MKGVDASSLGSRIRPVLYSLMLVCFGAAVICAQENFAANDPPKCKNANGLISAEIVEILAAHNQIRSGLKLPPLTWDCKLADLAGQWATRGVFEHRTDIAFGESIFVSGDRGIAAGTSVNKWMLEKPYWNNKTATCAPGKICSHYTQIVWKKTRQIGCGINRNTPGKWKVIIVCNYDPAGNVPGPAY